MNIIHEKTGYFVIYNCMLRESKYKLSPEELSLYALLTARKSLYSRTTETTIAALSKVQQIFNDDTRNAKNIKQLLLMLMKKEVIHIHYDGTSLNNNTIIVIDFPILEVKGFEKIYPDLYEVTSDPKEFYVLAVLKAFGKKGFSQRLIGWSKFLGYNSKNSADGVIKGLLSKDLIRIEEGARRETNGQFTSEPITYYLNIGLVEKQNTQVSIGEEDISNPSSASTETMKNYDESSVYDTIIGELTLQEIKKLITNSNIGKKTKNKDGTTVSAQITQDDYVTYCIVKEHSLDNAYLKRFEDVKALYESKEYYDGRFQTFKDQYAGQVASRKEERKEGIANDEMMHMHGTPVVLMDGSIFELNQENVNNLPLQNVSQVAFLTSIYKVDDFGELTIKQKLERYFLTDIVGRDRKFEMDTWIQIKQHFVQTAADHKFTEQDAEQLKNYTDKLCAEQNEGRSQNEDWEGDEWDIDENRSINQSKMARIRSLKQKTLQNANFR